MGIWAHDGFGQKDQFCVCDLWATREEIDMLRILPQFINEKTFNRHWHRFVAKSLSLVVWMRRRAQRDALACFHFIHNKASEINTFSSCERDLNSYHMCRKWISQYFGQPYLIFHELINGVIFFITTNTTSDAWTHCLIFILSFSVFIIIIIVGFKEYSSNWQHFLVGE